MRTHVIADTPKATTQAVVRGDDAHPGRPVVHAQDIGDLERIEDYQAQVVIWEPRPIPSWMEACAASVRIGTLSIARTNRSGLGRADIEELIGELVPDAFSFSEELRRDVLSLTDRLQRITGWRKFQLRIFTEAPSMRCGFHVDTVPPGLPPIGLMRVYAGSPTLYADRSNIVSMASFYRYLSRRERLLRDLNGGEGERASAALLELDRSPEFLREPADLKTTGPGAVVAFRHLDAADHWNGERGPDAWIHSSPMTGERRMVVNVCPSR